MDEGQKRRSTSPYHERCFPPYCDQAHEVDKTLVAKLEREDLEDKYIYYADENLELKKTVKNQATQIQRLQTAMARQDKLDKRRGDSPTSRVVDYNKIEILETQNKHLQSKLKVLKQQLLNHSYIHSHENGVPGPGGLPQKQTPLRTPRDSYSTVPKQSQSARDAKTDKTTAALKARVGELENQLETQKKKYKAQIAALEKELTEMEKGLMKSGTSVNDKISETSRQVKDNTELIKMRMQAEKQAKEIEELKKKLTAAEEEIGRLTDELKEAKARADDLEKQLEKERNKSQAALSVASKGTTHMETIKALEEQVRDLQKERDELKDANEKLLQLTQKPSSIRAPSGHSLMIRELEGNLKEKTAELEEKEEKLKKLEKQLEDALKAAEGGHADSTAQLEKLKDEIKTLKDQITDLERDIDRMNQEKDGMGYVLEDMKKQMTEKEEKEKKLVEELNEAKEELTKLRGLAGKVGDEEALKKQIKTLEEQLDSVQTEAKQLRTVAEEHKECSEIITSKDEQLKTQSENYEQQLNKVNKELNEIKNIVEEHKKCLEIITSKDEQLKTQSENYEQQLNKVNRELNEVKDIAEQHKNCETRITNIQETLISEKRIVEEEVKKTKEEVNVLRNIAEEHKHCESKNDSKEQALKQQNEFLEDKLNEAVDELNSLRNFIEEHKKEDAEELAHRKDLENRLSQADEELKELRPIAEEHKNCRRTPLPSTSSRDDALRKQNALLEEHLNQAKEELSYLRPVAEQHKHCPVKPLTPVVSAKSTQAPSVLFNKEEEQQPMLKEMEPISSAESVKSKNTIDSVRYQELKRQLEEALWENEKLKRELAGRDGDDALKRQNQRLEDELRKALRELEEVKPIAEDHLQNCPSRERPHEPYKEKSPVASYHSQPKEPLYSTPAKETSYHSQPKVTSYHSQPKETSYHSQPKDSYHSQPKSEKQKPSIHSYTSRQPQQPEYVSHVSPAPSKQCAQVVDLNDPEQKANLLIVSRHDFETVLMQKKKYSQEVEVVEPVDGKQTLNCKLEICMYDLDIDDRMLEYLTSIQSEPRVYVEWSFVGLDQRTAPLPAQQALFYTNVMYYGPLSNEIKSYLNKVEMPIDLYLVKANGPPQKVAEGSLDMLPAMEQPNRGFMRSVFLRGKDMPSRYASDKPVATIHCSFILHECCLGDPPFKNQLEIAIGTLYLKNRDGIVPDHDVHIYIEYALLGHCGPDLETDSVPRGEVMKFNHTKKLMVNDDNAPHLKAMLKDNNPKPLRFTVLSEPCSLTTDTEVETVGHADINLNEAMIKPGEDLVSSQVPVYSQEGEHLGTLSVTVLGVGTLQHVYENNQVVAK